LMGLLVLVGMISEFLNPGGLLSKLVLVSAMIISGYPLAVNGFKALLNGIIGIDLLATIAAVGATILGQYQEGALVVYLMSLSLKLEVMASERARKAVKELMELRPETATLRTEAGEEVVPVERVLPGEVFILKPGDRIPLDGVVIEGETTVDQSAITGESIPVYKSKHSEVYAGSINVDGYLAVETTRASSETMLSSILRMIQEAESRRSPIETTVNRFARYYTPLILFLSFLFVVVPPLLQGTPLKTSLYNGLVLLVIGCPCALTLATPVAMVSAITRASKNGVLIKGSVFIEALNRAKTYVFDKTGTLTTGRPRVTDILALGISEDEVLGIASTLEEKSKHPLAEAIKEEASRRGAPLYEVEMFHSVAGRGVTAFIGDVEYRLGSLRLADENRVQYPVEVVRSLESQGKTVVILSRGRAALGIIALMDVVRESSKAAIEELRLQGFNVVMLTGDNEATAAAIGGELGIEDYYANLLPDEKLNVIEKLRRSGPVVMVGDGVNDAPALAAADVGVAMGGLGSDVALETADIVLLYDDLSRLCYTQKLSRVAVSRVWENITVSLLMKLVIVSLAAAGLISLWASVVLGDVGLTLLVILNSSRL